MFHAFLTQNRTSILDLVFEKASDIAEKRTSSDILDQALPTFLDQIIEVLKREVETRKEILLLVPLDSATKYGRELLRLGYTISQVVHLYGIVCEAVMETVAKKSFTIAGSEFRRFNICFDDSIAAAVTEYERAKRENLQRDDSEKLGYLIHELRNMVTSAHLSLQMIKKGVVGIAGSTGGVLDRSLNRMRELIDRTVTEIRSLGQTSPGTKFIRLIEVVGEVEAVILNEALSKQVTIHVDINPEARANANQDDLFSALSNLVHNAVKFTNAGGNIWVRSAQTEEHEIIEVEDECGGIAPSKMESLFTAFTQVSQDKSGLGLGLTIARRSIRTNGGDIVIQNLPGKGCIFSILLPRLQPTYVEQKKG